MSNIQNGWFCEINNQWFGQAMSFEIEKILCQCKTKYQDVLLFKSKSHGNVLVLDGCVQCTDRDEFTYQEMITYLPLNSHPNPKNVLIVGGGDGGVAREVAKNPLVESIVQCEIDEDVVNLCKRYLPNMACGYSSPKHKLHVGCGKAFMKEHEGQFDVIITDSSDPIGPAATLFQKEYYELMRSALKPDGLLCSQGECPWCDSQFIKNMLQFCKPLFPVVSYGYVNVPTYPSGQIGFILCSKNSATKFDQPVINLNEQQLSSFHFKWYNLEIHQSAFALPEYFEKSLTDFNRDDETKAENWFWENLKKAPGQSFGLLKEEILYENKIDKQNVLVFKSYSYGNVLVIDDIIQYTALTQCITQECLAHLSLSSHPEPKKVLIIGAQSAGIVQEVLRHESVEYVVQCEKSKELVDVSKQYFPSSSAGYNSFKLNLDFGEYEDFLRNHPNEFDVVITVPTEDFLKPENSELLKRSLKPNGIAISQVPTFWLYLDDIKTLIVHDKKLFSTVSLASLYVPTCPYGQVTVVLRSINSETCFKTPLRQLSEENLSKLQYYNSKVHEASFALPQFVRNVIDT